MKAEVGPSLGKTKGNATYADLKLFIVSRWKEGLYSQKKTKKKSYGSTEMH